ncbi:hypothetical protein BVRB_4g095490 [Beta vulgaris subsp. vulgaris]|uniref:Secreted protein n=1 Tax=Beta vulgaris subsp. vulgaris TaxID=3555 RepID=A0A0J8B9X4_BETVV|nr:hypothetical protein BVRB_4g095490 [Beta vulgaris subsp. vulgaris]
MTTIAYYLAFILLLSHTSNAEAARFGGYVPFSEKYMRVVSHRAQARSPPSPMPNARRSPIFPPPNE